MTSEVPGRGRDPQTPRHIPVRSSPFPSFTAAWCASPECSATSRSRSAAGGRSRHLRLSAAGSHVELGRRASRTHDRNRLVLFGFVPLLVSLGLSLLVLALPASPQMDPARLSAFETVMSGTPRIWLGGILAYGISTFLNVTIFSRLKASEGRGLLWLRAAIASVLSQIVDTFIFILVAFYGVFPIGELILGQMLAKVVLSALLVPPLVYAFVALAESFEPGSASIYSAA